MNPSGLKSLAVQVISRSQEKIMPLVIVIVLVALAGLFIYVYRGGPRLPPETDAILESVFQNELPEIVHGETGFATSQGFKIWYERIAPQAESKGTVLLIMSIGGNALDWPPRFIRALLDAGYQVIRYDQRGTGLSDWVENWDRKNPYSIADMAGDAVAVLDALGIQKAHVAGLSMGGMVAQEVAIQQPERIASLTLMMTSGYVGDPDLPSLSSGYFLSSVLKGLPLLKYRIAGGEKNLIKERIAKTIAFVGAEGLDIREMAEMVLYDLRKRRGANIKAFFQQQAAVSISGSRIENLKRLNVPTLVIHGTADPLIPVEHGRKLVDVIPNAKALWLEGVGHVFPYPNMDIWMNSIISHLDNR
jgi:pimeloyl-ACP methyl ester carboxylesterase